MYFQFANVLVFFALAFVLCGMMLGLGILLRPANPSRSKLSTYECGEPPSGPAWINFNIRFYLIALVFVIFDVELAFVYPVVTVYREDRKSTRLNSSHGSISYAVFCLKKKLSNTP